MEENLNIFGKNQGEIGSLDKNLVLRTKGRVYIRYGRKYIDLLDSQGNLNVKVPKVLSKITSKDEIKSNGFYLLDGNLYAYVDGETFQITGTEGSFISYAIQQKLTSEQIDIAQRNIGLKFDSINEAVRSVQEGIVFIGSDSYYINNGTYTKLGLSGLLETLNNSNLPPYPEYDNQCIAYLNGQWTYAPFITQQDLTNLKQEIIREIDDGEGDEDNLDTNTFDPVEYSKVYSIKEGQIVNSTIQELKTVPTFNQSTNDIAIISFNVTEVLNHTQVTQDGETLVALKAGNQGILTLNLKVTGDETLSFITESGSSLSIETKDGYVFTGNGNLPTTAEEILAGEKMSYLIINNVYYILEEGLSLDNKNIYIKAEQSNKEKFKLDYTNSKISIEENYPNPTQINQHVVLGNIKSFSVYKDRADQGLYSDNPVFVGSEFKGTDVFKEYPRYTAALNTLLCDNHSNVANGNNFDNVIPTIKWVKQNSSAPDLSNYYTKNQTYSKTEVDNLISSVTPGGGDSMPVGSIIMFGKPQDQIPSGWHICDGTNGTPDLTDKFIVGAGNSYQLNNTGGVRQNTISGSNLPQHYHNVSDYYLFDSNESLANANLPGLSTGKGGLVQTTGGTYHGSHEADGDNNTWAFITHLTSGTVDFSGNPISYDAGTDLTLDNRPPFYALYYIMKIS